MRLRGLVAEDVERRLVRGEIDIKEAVGLLENRICRYADIWIPADSVLNLLERVACVVTRAFEVFVMK